MTRKEIIEKLGKIKKLAEKGVAGEMEAAHERLIALMDKYGITEDDLEEKEEPILYMIDAENHEQLFVQVYHSFFSVERKVFDISKMKAGDRKFFSKCGHGDKNATIAIECTKSELVQIIYLFKSYLSDYKKQYAAFEYAYYRVNKLLPKKTGDVEGKETDVNLQQVLELSNGIERHTVNKAIENV